MFPKSGKPIHKNQKSGPHRVLRHNFKILTKKLK